MTSVPIHISVAENAFCLADVLKELLRPQESGGQCVFEGIIRNHNAGRPVSRLEYECYEELTIKECHRIAAEAQQRFQLTEVLMKHRIGPLEIGETAVVVIALAHHRNEAFLGTRYMIDELKKRAPIWKKEFYADGSHGWPRCTEHH